MGAREDKAKAEVIGKLRALAQRRQTTPEGLFRLYDADGGGALNRAELRNMLTDADVGSRITRGAYVSKIFERLDADHSQGLTLAELDGMLRSADLPTNGGVLTRAEAAVIARRIAAGEQVDLGRYAQADLALIEEENLKLTQPIPDQKQVPKLPTRPPAPQPAGGGGAFVLLALVALLVLARG